ncbi:protein-L-isoaspartate(D-aspartate) O-methyltransferase [Methanococcoides alaskense]|uniref:Protein-L-isoaspartate O-methyltransferase n=2 Tax=Methanococcoides alaskense TaxID=325778 RepID=A0AA90TY83_9EURY|nr:protein-L-isoaspartate(D-aspartate) O-methyltransferase [Methanococcoides alaskense]
MGRRENLMEPKGQEILIRALELNGTGERVRNAMRKVPRHLFVSEDMQSVAYADTPLPIGHDQTISAPHMVAIMCDLLEITEGMTILEIGSGSGYNAAVMAELVGKNGKIYTIERIPELAELARSNLERAGYSNVTVIHDDGSCGLPEHAPYERITVTSAAPEVPQPLREQLSKNGIMVAPVGTRHQNLVIVRKDNEGNISYRTWGEVIFVPLIGKYGF